MKKLLSTPSMKKAIYNYITRQDHVSKAELQQLFHTNSSGLTRLLDDLVSEGYIVESGFGQSTGGRRPILYQVNPHYGYILGMEISRTHSSLGLFNMKLEPLSLTHWNMDETMTPMALIQHTQQVVQTFIARHNINKELLLGIGVGTVGPIDRANGIILNPRYFHAEGWNNVPLQDLMGEALGLNVLIENGANTALLGEHWHEREDNVQHMLYVHVGTGLRSAMMSNGNIVHGAIDMEEAIGQMIIQVDGPRLHESGNYGALEAFASIQALEKQVRAQLKMGRKLFTQQEQPEHIDFQLLLQHLAEGNPYIHELFEQAATYMGIGLANLINILHPEKIVLGGALMNSNELFYETTLSSAQKNICSTSHYQPVFSRGKLREHAVAAGAAAMIYHALPI
ncbi:N-acetylglucosamine repressor [compost metagenome]